MVHPIPTFLGAIELDGNRIWEATLPPLGRSEHIEVLIEAKHLPHSVGKHEFAMIALQYDVPSQRIKNEVGEVSIYVEYTDDPMKMRQVLAFIREKHTVVRDEELRVLIQQAEDEGDVQSRDRLLSVLATRTKCESVRSLTTTMKSEPSGEERRELSKQMAQKTRKRLGRPNDKLFSSELPTAGDRQSNVAASDKAGVRGQITAYRFSAFHPEMVKPNQVGKLIAYVHRESMAREVVADAKNRIQLSPNLNLKVGTIPDTIEVPSESTITVIPDIPGLNFDILEANLRLWEDVQSVEFRFKPTTDLQCHLYEGWVHFWLESIALADVRIKIFVSDDKTHDVYQAAMAEANSHPYRAIFPSYSNKDETIVERLDVYAASFGDEYFRDLTRLRTGQSWRPELMKFIQTADVFQLFWSSQAAESQYVEDEWRHALTERAKRNDPYFLRPVYRTPKPQQPIPDDQNGVHFARLPLNTHPGLE